MKNHRRPRGPAVWRGLTRRILAAAVPLLLAVLVISCGGSPPEILYADAQLFLFQNHETGIITESLRLYVAVNDGDGTEDLSVLSVVHDASELYWQASAEEWVSIERDGDSWIGLPDLRPVSGQLFPRGRYRLILEDESLQETEGDFSLTAPPLDLEEVVFPTLTGGDADPTVISDGPVTVRVFNRTGTLVVSRETSSGPLSDVLLREVPEESGLQVYLYSPPGDGIRLMAGPYELNR